MSEDQEVLSGRLPSPEEKQSLNLIRELQKGTIQKTEEAAKQLITLATLSQTIYFASLSFSEAKKSLEILKPDLLHYWGFLCLLILPLIPWFVSLYCAVEVFRPKDYQTSLNSPTSAEKTILGIITNKGNNLCWSYFLLKTGFIIAFVTLFVYLVFVPLPPPEFLLPPPK